jgi:flagellar biosynthesis component FlhA
MKTYIEISQPTTTSSILAIRMEKLQSLLQSLTSKFKGLSLRNRLILVALVMAMIALFFGCNLFSLILIALFLIALGVVINEFVEYIRFIRELE